MVWSSAVSYCDGLELGGQTDWRLPNIDEMISLLRGCVDGTATGDLSPSACEMSPAGCAATDTCGGSAACDACSIGSGPASGCYWDPALSGPCDWHWSSSSYADDVSGAWGVLFYSGDVFSNVKADYYYARCVRNH